MGSSELLRKKARQRGHFWPGAAFALLGHPILAACGTAVFVLVLLAFVYFSLALSPTALWVVIAALAGGLCFYLVEQIVSRSIQVVPAGETSFPARYHVPLCMAGYVALLGVLCFCILNVGSMQVRGQGMSPTLLPGERFLYQKRIYTEDLHPGHLVLFKTSPESSWGKGGDLVVARILAVPGDKLAVEGQHYLVNGKKTVPVSSTGQFKLAIEVPQVPEAVAVPPSCYFIVQDDPRNSFDSRVLSWAREKEIVGTKVLLLSGRGFGLEVE